ncbi:MAG: ribonuclease HI family protein [Candidatus Krumholzibacteria bacterium]|nr:ribonuclease HI family protein [Candidatus Krumholzibacteria bacterium]
MIPRDPALAAKLAGVLAALERGETLQDAFAEAGVSHAEAARLLAAAREMLRPPPSRGAPPSGALSVIVHADGGSRGNPGPAACAAILVDARGDELLRRTRRLGIATNNAAEYEAVILALEAARELSAYAVELRLDSELVARQIEGRYKVKHPDLKPLHARVMALLSAFGSYDVVHVRRVENREADALVNRALDGKDEDG